MENKQKFHQLNRSVYPVGIQPSNRQQNTCQRKMDAGQYQEETWVSGVPEEPYVE